MGGDRAGAVAGDRSEGVPEGSPDGVGLPRPDLADWRARGELLRLLWEAAPLRGLSRAALRDLAGQAREVELPAGAALCRAGDHADLVYLLPADDLDGDDGQANGDGVAMVGGEVLRGARRYERTVVARGAARGWALPAWALVGAVGAGRDGRAGAGERKRASIAVELLTRPRVFFLDEPTSGLDPANAAELLRLLRRLADEGATVVLTTHNPVDVDACDKVAVLAREGNLAFAGTPEAARRHFQVRTVSDIYGRLADEGDPAAWRLRFPGASGQGAAGPAGDGRGPVPVGARRGVGAARQWLLLSRRTLDILARNRLTLAILLGSPVVILLMFLMLFKPDAFSFAAPSPSTTVMILFWIAFGGFFFGLTYGLLQICNEVGVLRREAMTGLRIGPYVLSKAAVLVPLLALVDALLLGVLRWLDRLPALGAADFGALFVTLLLASACALGLGLLASAAVSDPSQATLMLPMLCFPQVLFVGAILPVPLMAAVGRWLSAAMSNRWAFEALGHSAGIERLWRDGGSPLGPPLLAAYGDSFSRPVGVNWATLGAFTAAFFVATCVVLARNCAVPAAGRRRASGAHGSEVRP